MVSDCIELCSAPLPFNLEHAKFASPTYLLPTRKDLWPLHTMVVDLITGLKYPDGTMSSTLAVAICVFCKWLEAKFLTNRSSREATRWFHEAIVCQFCTPCVVRTNHGMEFQGEFHAYLECMGIKHSFISVAHPHVNGLIERYNGMIRRGLRMWLAALPGIHPREALPEVLAGIRMLPTQVGLSPFMLLYK